MDDKILLCEIGQRIRKARNDKKLSQEDLAFKAGLSTCSISDIELGKTNLGVLTLIKIIEALNVSADIILRHPYKILEYYKTFSSSSLFNSFTKKSQSFLLSWRI